MGSQIKTLNMNYIVWNDRGVGNNIKRTMVREIIKSHQLEIECLVETKIKNPTYTTLRQLDSGKLRS